MCHQHRSSTTVSHFKKQYPRSNVVHKQKGKLETRQAHLGECMHTSDSQTIQGHSSQKSPYGLSDNEKVLSAVAQWGTYDNMKVSQAGRMKVSQAGRTISGRSDTDGTCCRYRHLDRCSRRTGTVQSLRVFRSKKCYTSSSGCSSSASDGDSGLE